MPARVTEHIERSSSRDDLRRKYPFQRFFVERDNLTRLLKDSGTFSNNNQALLSSAHSVEDQRAIWIQTAKSFAADLGLHDPADRDLFAVSVADEKVGLGGLEDLIRDTDVMNVMVHISEERETSPVVRVHYTDNSKSNIPIRITSGWDTYKNQLINNAINLSRKQIKFDQGHTYIEMVLPDGPEKGARFVSSLVEDGRAITTSMRLNRVGSPDLANLRESGLIPTDELYDFLLALVYAQANALFVGPQQSGKTTLLRGFINSFPPSDEVLIVEDIPELMIEQGPRHEYCVSQQPTSDQNMTMIITRAMRYVVKRICVGEAIDAAITNWLFASIRLRGGACTIHADSIDGTFNAIRTLSTIVAPGVAPMPLETLMQSVADCLDVVVFLSPEPRKDDPMKSFPSIKGIVAIDGKLSDGGIPKNVTLWDWNEQRKELVWQGNHLPDRLKERLAQIGVAFDISETRMKVVNRERLPKPLYYIDQELTTMQRVGGRGF
jgi:Flp pilus assembly CpaF family ATPase